MTINGFVRPDEKTDDDLDVPDWVNPSSAHPVIVGEVVRPDGPPADEPEDDIAPGVLEVRPYRPPVLSRTGSAAMVVAATTGRVVGLSARGGWTLSRWFGHGARSTAVLGYRYVRAIDHQEALGGMNGPGWRKVLDTRVRRWKTLGYTAGAVAGVDLAAWWALVKYAGLSALDWSWAVAPGTETLFAAAAMTLYGRYRLQAGLAPGQIVDPQDVDADPDEPFPLSWCQDGEQVRECISRALAYEGIDTRRINILGHRPWGWEIDIELKGSTPGKVGAVADQLDTHFNIARGGTLIEPDPDESAHIVLRLVTSDPFEGMPAPQVHAPNSLSVRDVVVYGRGMDGSPLEFRLQGMSMLIIGVSGSAKTKGALRCIAEAITACRDAIAIEMDPIKDGLREFSGAMATPPIRGGEACTNWLSYLVRIASVRSAIKNDLDMGDLWQPTPDHPTIFVIVDEFIFLPTEGKANAVELLRIGRELGIHLIFAAQESTEDALGDAIADSVTYRIMLASRAGDIRLTLGTGAAADGYRPDRLRPAVDEERVYDAGKFYIKGPGYLRPIQWRWNRFSRDQIKQAVADREAAGRPWFDHDSLAAAGLLHIITRTGTTPAATITVADRLDALAQQGGIEDAAHVAILLREFELAGALFLPTSEVLLPALRNAGADLDADKLARLLRRHAPGAKTTREEWAGVEGRPRGWTKSAIEQAAAGLMDPARARREAG